MKKISTLFMGGMLCLAVNADAQSNWKEDFESVTAPALPSGWTQKTGITKGWYVATSSVSFGTTGFVCPAHTKYAIINDQNNEANDPNMLVTSAIDLTGVAGAFMKFAYYYNKAAYTNGSKTEDFNIKISIDGGTTWIQAGTPAALAQTWGQYYLDLSNYENEADVRIGFEFDDDNGGNMIGAAVDDLELFIPPSAEAKLTEVNPKSGSLRAYGVAGANNPFGGTIYNNGGDTIKSIKVHYQEGSSPVVTDVLTGLSIAPFTSYKFGTLTDLALPSTHSTDYPVKMWLELTGDADATNDSGKTVLTGVQFMPPKKIAVEEATGTWCGWCPRGAVYMDSVWHKYPNNFSLVAVHNDDPMEDVAYDALMRNLLAGKGYPGIIVDRRMVSDPSQLVGIYEEQKDYFGFAELALESPDAPQFDVSIKAKVKPAINLNGDYRVVVVVTEDDVTGEGQGWGQANYYNNYIPLSGAGVNWFTAGSVVNGLSYDFVGRTVLPTGRGVAGGLPSTMNAGTVYEQTITGTINPQYKRANMRAVVMLLRASDGAVLNSNYTTFTTGISNVDAGIKKVTVYPNPANYNTNVNFTLVDASNVQVMVTDAMGRVVNTVNAGNMTAGTHKLDINTANFANGVYNVTIKTDKGSITERLSVVK